MAPRRLRPPYEVVDPQEIIDITVLVRAPAPIEGAEQIEALSAQPAQERHYPSHADSPATTACG